MTYDPIRLTVAGGVYELHRHARRDRIRVYRVVGGNRLERVRDPRLAEAIVGKLMEREQAHEDGVLM